MNRNKIIELAKKIKALAEKGKGGERNAAKEKLERICQKYNISKSELSTSEEAKNYYIVINDSNERELLINVCCMILDVPGFKWKEKNNCICIHITQPEYENINIVGVKPLKASLDVATALTSHPLFNERPAFFARERALFFQYGLSLASSKSSSSLLCGIPLGDAPLFSSASQSIST